MFIKALAGLGSLLLGAGKSAISTAALVAGFYGVVIVTLHLITDALFRLANAFIGAAIDFNLSLTSTNFVNYGHKILLGFANMLFIVALVFIAFATMLRWEQFNYKKALPRLIVVMLLINFGSFIVKDWFIAPVNTITQQIRLAANFNENTFSIGSLLDPRGQLADGISTGGNVEKATCPDLNNDGQPDETCPTQEVSKQIPGFAEKIGAFLAQTIASIIFSLISILALFAFAIMLLIRGIALSFLIILLPLAWVTWAFPNLKLPGGGNPWQMWWESFIRWLLFAPFAMFFFFLAIQFTNLDVKNQFLDASGQALAIVGFMVGGLIVANKMGITGSGYALAVANKGKMWAQTKAKRYGLKAGRGTIRKALPRERLQKLENLGVGRGFLGRHLAAPARAVGRRAVRGDAAITKAREAEFREKIKDLAPYQVADMYAGLNEEERAYALKYMIEKGYDWELVPEARKDVINWANKGYFDKDVYGLKKAELDLVDSGISPDAIAAQAKYKGELREAYKEFQEAKERGAPKSELQKRLQDMRRIKFEGQEKMRDAYYKNLNVITPAGFAKIQRRMLSTPKFDTKTGEWQAPYAMYSGDVEDKNDFLEMQGMLVDYMHEKRPAAINRVRGSLRGDGTARMSRGTQEHVPRFLENFVDPIREAYEKKTGSKLSREDVAKQREQRLQLFTDYWEDIQEHLLVEAGRTADNEKIRQGLDSAGRNRIFEKRKAEIMQMTPGEIAGFYDQLLQATRGAVNLAYAG